MTIEFYFTPELHLRDGRIIRDLTPTDKRRCHVAKYWVPQNICRTKLLRGKGVLRRAAWGA
jgi:hypothetical protein